jgi:metal-responsive CopG/Arc/MetJ family transcriptional regulator
MAFDTTKETMASFLVPSQLLDTIDDIRNFEGNPSRSSIIRRLINRRLKSCHGSEHPQRQTNKILQLNHLPSLLNSTFINTLNKSKPKV